MPVPAEDQSWLHRQLGLTFWWDVRKLWAADLPVLDVSVADLAWLLDLPFWSEDGRELTLSPRAVAANPERYRAEYDRTMRADLAFPINVIELDGRLVVMDGVHRLLKARLFERATISAKVAQPGDIPAFSRMPWEPSNHPVPDSPGTGTASAQATVSVVAAVFLDGDRVLACRRHRSRPAGGKWEFPGGKVEQNETPAAALAREIDEELGVAITVGELLDRTATTVDGVTIDLACYQVSVRGRSPERSRDHDRLEWVAREALEDLDWAEPDLPTVHKLSRHVPDKLSK